MTPGALESPQARTLSSRLAPGFNSLQMKRAFESIRISMDLVRNLSIRYRMAVLINGSILVAQAAEKERLSARDWEEEALQVIGEEGVGAIAVERLARRLGVTKGSFYWHFANRDALLEAAIERWEQNDLRTFERSVELFKDPHDKMRSLFRRTRKDVFSHVIFCALFRAADHPVVGPVMQRVSERRIKYLQSGFSEFGMEPKAALNRARMTYMSYVGFLLYYRQFSDQRMRGSELDEYTEHMIETLIPK